MPEVSTLVLILLVAVVIAIVLLVVLADLTLRAIEYITPVSRARRAGASR